MKTLSIRSLQAVHLVLWLVLALGVGTASALELGEISDSAKYAWSETSAWQNFKPTHGGVTVHRDHLSGYVWSGNVGWIKLCADGPGPYANSSASNWCVNRNAATGVLSGYAWGENIGWIKFNPTHSQVTVDPVTGNFAGYAWGGNIGYVHFQNATPAYKVQANLKVKAPSVLTVPTNSSTASFEVSWAASGDLGVSYVLEEATNNTFTAGNRPINVGVGVTAVTIRSRVSGTTYFYRVKAIKAGFADSLWQTNPTGCLVMLPVAVPASIKVPVSVPDAPFTVSWGRSAMAGVTYLLEEAVSDTFAGATEVYRGPSLKVQLSGRTANTTYFYRVKAIKTNYSDSIWRVGANGCLVKTLAAPPASITVPAYDADGNNFTVKWTASPTIGVTYLLQEATNPDFTGFVEVYRGTGFSTKLSGRALGNTYYYRVRAIRTAYTGSAWRVGGNGCDISPLSHTAWFMGSTNPADPAGREANLIVFLDRSHYMFAKSTDGTSDPNCTIDGIEHGTYTWNPVDDSLVVTATYKTPGFDCGLEGGVMTATVSGPTLTLEVVGEGSVPLTRVVRSDTNPIVGTWFVGNPDPVAQDALALIFLNDNDFMIIDHEVPDADGTPGLEHGTYTWEQGSGLFTAAVTVDTNGGWGMGDGTPGSGPPVGTTVSIANGILTVHPAGGEVFTVKRLY